MARLYVEYRGGGGGGGFDDSLYIESFENILKFQSVFTFIKFSGETL